MFVGWKILEHVQGFISLCYFDIHEMFAVFFLIRKQLCCGIKKGSTS